MNILSIYDPKSASVPLLKLTCSDINRKMIREFLVNWRNITVFILAIHELKVAAYLMTKNKTQKQY